MAELQIILCSIMPFGCPVDTSVTNVKSIRKIGFPSAGLSSADSRVCLPLLVFCALITYIFSALLGSRICINQKANRRWSFLLEKKYMHLNMMTEQYQISGMLLEPYSARYLSISSGILTYSEAKEESREVSGGTGQSRSK